MMRHPPIPAVAALSAALALTSSLARADDGSANCALITQAAAGGMAARIQADDRDIAAPRSVTTLSCLDGFFNGVGLNVVTNLLNPGNLLAAVEGKICAAVQQTWTNLIGSVQCGLTITGFDLGFGGLGGGNFCPSLSFGGGGPTWASAGIGGSANGGGLYINGTSVAPTGYTVPPNAGFY